MVFSVKPKIFFGSGVISQLDALDCSSAFLVTDSFFVANGLADKLAKKFQHCTIFSQVTADPSTEIVAKGSALFSQGSHDVVIALGGGSPMDCAKAILHLADRRPFFVAIPTTSGTGSEVTSFSIVSHGAVKHPIVHEDLAPDWAILDTDLVEHLPKPLIAVSGFDALVHAVEAFGSTGGNVFTQPLAIKSFQTILENLEKSYDGDLIARGQVHLSATMSGIAFDQAGLGICHSLAHALGGMFHVPHGLLGAVLLPAVMTFNQDAVDYRPLGGLSPRNLIGRIVRLREHLGLPAKLELNVRPYLEQLAQTALEDPCTKTNPRPPTLEDLKQILVNIL